MSHFENLPEELKEKILEYLFSDDDDDDSSQNPGAHDAKEYSISIPSLDIDISTKPWTVQPESKEIYPLNVTVRPHQNFTALFTSRSFLHSALPVYIRSASLELCCMKYCVGPISELSCPSILDETLSAILSRIETIKIWTDHEFLTTMQLLLRTAFPRLQTLIFQDPKIMIWSHFKIRRSDDSPVALTIRDVFQTMQVAQICHQTTRVILSEEELQGLKSEDKTFPGDLAILCQYIEKAAGRDYPRVMHRLVAIGCYTGPDWEVRSNGGRFSSPGRRKIVMNLKIDVRARVVLAVDVRDQTWAGI